MKENLPSGPIEEVLRDGTVLCRWINSTELNWFYGFINFSKILKRLINKLKPGSIPKIHTTGGQFKIMENMENFQKAIMRYGVPDLDVFQTVDLYEKRNIPQVVHSIMALGRAVSINCQTYNYFKIRIDYY